LYTASCEAASLPIDVHMCSQAVMTDLLYLSSRDILCCQPVNKAI